MSYDLTPHRGRSRLPMTAVPVIVEDWVCWKEPSWHALDERRLVPLDEVEVREPHPLVRPPCQLGGAESQQWGPCRMRDVVKRVADVVDVMELVCRVWESVVVALLLVLRS